VSDGQNDVEQNCSLALFQDVTAISSNLTTSNLTAGMFDEPNTPTNATSRRTSNNVVMIPSVVSVSGPTSGDGAQENVVKKSGTAQWALIVVVLARSLMY
jgi:hypothetical protein